MKRILGLTALVILFSGLSVAQPSQVTVNEGVIINQDSQVKINSTSQLNLSKLTALTAKTNLDESNLTISQEQSDYILVELDKYNVSDSPPEESINFTANATNGNKVTFTHSGLGTDNLFTVNKDGSQIAKKSTDQQGQLQYSSSSWSRSRIVVTNQSVFDENLFQKTGTDADGEPQVIYSDEQHTQDSSIVDKVASSISFDFEIADIIDLDILSDTTAKYEENPSQDSEINANQGQQVDYLDQQDTQDTSIIDKANPGISFDFGFSDIIDIETLFSTATTPEIQGLKVYNSDGQPVTQAPEGEKISVKANITDADGRNNLDTATINLTDPNGNSEVVQASMKDVGNVDNGNTYRYNYTLPDQVDNAGEWTVEIEANDKDSNTNTGQTTFIHQYLIKNEQEPQQDADATIFDEVPFTESANYENPSQSRYQSVKASIRVPTAIVTNSTTLINQNGNSISHTVNKTQGLVEFTIPKINAETTRDYTLDYKVEAPNVSTATFSTIDASGRNSTVQQFNISSVQGFEYPDLQAETSFSNPGNVVSYYLTLNGTEVTTEPDYNFDTSDQDGDGTDETVEWTVPSLTGRQDYEVRALRGFPLQVERENIITNKPVTDTKNIEWRSGFRFNNRNSFSIDVNYKARLPLRSNDIILGNRLIEKKFDNQGAYIPIQFSLSGNSNRTRFVEYTTPTVSATRNNFRPDVNWINRRTTNTVNVTFINELPLETKQVQDTISILSGSNLKTTLENGTVIDTEEQVEGRYRFNVSTVPANGETTVSVTYDVPVAESTYQGSRNVSSGNKLDVWKIESKSPVARTNTKFYSSNITCIEAQRAYVVQTNQTQEIECKDTQAVVDVGTLGPNQNFELAIEHKEYNVVVENTILFYRVLAANSTLASIVLILFITASSGAAYLYRKERLPWQGQK